jgi:nitroimidazol reductase NimA-like FMN-containing flavoprotein (pyridoxamine 5'-phosphate oxidase superfamily)
MRRKKLESKDMAVFDQIVSEAEVGYLGIMTEDGYPRVVPVNFVSIDRVVYFHGAVEGEKYDLIKQSPKVTFSVDIPLAIIPSYWLSDENAGGATHLFKSILIKGRAGVVNDNNARCFALQKLMEKYQPEGQFLPIAPDEKEYDKILSITAVFRIDAENVTIKVKLPTDKPENYKLSLIDNLRKRGTAVDLKTADEIEQT